MSLLDQAQIRAQPGRFYASHSFRRGRRPSHLGTITARWAARIVFISRRPNVHLLTTELIDDRHLLVARSNDKGGIDVLGKIRIEP